MPEHLQTRFTYHARLSSFRRKVEKATTLIEEWLSLCHTPYVAFSGGKDSSVVLHLVRSLAPCTPAIYLDADCSFPEVMELVTSMPNCRCYPTSEPFLDVLERYGLSDTTLDRKTMKSTVYEPVVKYVQESGADGSAYGIRAEESYGRRQSVRFNSLLFFAKQYQVWQCQPIGYWTYDDVWAYLVSRHVPYAETYNKMWSLPEREQRVSYWAGETCRQNGRYVWLKQHYPELWRILCNRLPEVRSYT